MITDPKNIFTVVLNRISKSRNLSYGGVVMQTFTKFVSLPCIAIQALQTRASKNRQSSEKNIILSGYVK